MKGKNEEHNSRQIRGMRDPTCHIYDPSSTVGEHTSRIMLQRFQEGTDKIGAFLDTFEVMERDNASPKTSGPFSFEVHYRNRAVCHSSNDGQLPC